MFSPPPSFPPPFVFLRSAGPRVLGLFFVSLGATLDSAETPFAKTPFAETPLQTFYSWDHGFPLENTKSPHPENPEKLLKNYNLAHPGTILKITEKLLKNYKKSIFLVILRNFVVF